MPTVSYPRIRRFRQVSSLSKHFITWGGFWETSVRVRLDPLTRSLIPLLNGESSEEEVIRKLSKGNRFTPSRVKQRLAALYKRGLLENAQEEIGSLTSMDLERYSRQFVFFSMFAPPLQVQQKLKDARVFLLGLGGIGSYLLYALAGCGVGSLCCMDGDSIELSNLNRQILYNEAHIGIKKTKAAAETIQKFNSSVQVEFISEMAKNKSQIKKYILGSDLVILSGDSPLGIDVLVNQACLETKIPYTIVGYKEYFGSVGPLVLPGITSCLECDQKARYEPIRHNPTFVQYANKNFNPPSTAPVNGILANIQVLETLRFLSGFAKPATLDRQFLMNFKTWKSEWLSYQRNPRCKACGNFS